MNITLIKEGKFEEFVKAMCVGLITQDEDGNYYRMNAGKLEESRDLDTWMETNEFVFGTINGDWKIYIIQ